VTIREALAALDGASARVQPVGVLVAPGAHREPAAEEHADEREQIRAVRTATSSWRRVGDREQGRP
jgi:hypothetical protein